MNPTMQALAVRVAHEFLVHFCAPPDCVAQAPGRVNLIGEHTDYNDGFVLPCAIDFRTLVACRRREDSLVRVLAIDLERETDEFRLDQPIARRADHSWTNYVRGMFVELLALAKDNGHRIRGMELAISGDVPRGVGLSSSASLSMAVGQAFMLLNAFDIGATQLALAAQRAENNFAGCNCGIMDQLISGSARAGHALLIDCRSLTTAQVPLPPDVSVLVAHSRISRGLVESEYNIRRQQCEAAARYFGATALRDVGVDDVVNAGALDALTRRRALHVVTENQRVRDAAAALMHGDLPRMGELMAASHVSMRDDFEITLPPIDRLVEILQEVIGKEGGARMTGGGFGGAVVALLPRALIGSARAAVTAHYRAPNGDAAILYECVASAGAGAIVMT
jgi:galactokinase